MDPLGRVTVYDPGVTLLTIRRRKAMTNRVRTKVTMLVVIVGRLADLNIGAS